MVGMFECLGFLLKKKKNVYLDEQRQTVYTQFGFIIEMRCFLHDDDVFGSKMMDSCGACTLFLCKGFECCRG